MGKVKPWQIVVMVVAVVAVAASAYLSLNKDKGPKLIDEITMVDVTSGDLFVFPLTGKKSVAIPELNPDTGKRTLMPTYRNEAGEWTIGPRDRDALNAFKNEPKLVVEVSTGKVTVSATAPRKVR